MNFDILGPFRIRDPERREIRLPAGLERSLLVLLLINRGEVVSVDRIIEALWGEQPPDSAAKAVQGYVSHLRRTLDPESGVGGADGLLLTRAPGYALRADGVDVDSARFEKLAEEGSRALEEGSAADAAAAFAAALGLWRGPALAEFAYDDFAQAEILRLDELRLGVLEERAEALLRLGRNAEVVTELGPLVAESPLRERLRARLMLALYRSGRQADALQTYRDGRRLLAGDLGLEPGPELQRLEQAILAQDPELDGPVASRASPPAETASDEPSASPPDEPSAPPSAARPRRRLLLVAAGVVLALAAGAALGVVLTRGDTPSAVEIKPPAVVAVDPRTNRVVASIVAGSKPISIAAGEGGLWVGDQGDGTVTKIDPTTRRVVKVIGIGAPAIDIAAGAGGIWVATGSFGTVVRIDPGLGAVADRIRLGNAGDPVVPAISSVAVGGGRVWVGALNGLVALDPGTDEVTDRVRLGYSAALQIAAGGGTVWATVLASRAMRVDARSAKKTAEFYAGNFVDAIALGSEAVWIGGYPGQLWKVDPATAAVISSARTGTFTSSIAVGAGAVWVTLPGDGVLGRVDPDTGEIQRKIVIGGSPEDVVVDHGLIWVAVKEQPPPG